MIKADMRRKIFKCISLTVCMILLAAIVPAQVLKADAEGSGSGKIIVSLGDSYSSGEGIDDFYDYDLPLEDRVKSLDWLAHRSKNSWPGMLRLGNVKMADARDKNWYFVAASGAETKHLSEEEQIKKYSKKISSKERLEGEKTLPVQLSVFDELAKEGKDADYVTITIGGNDVGFADIIMQAAHPGKSSYLNLNEFSELTDMLIERVKSEDITKTLEDAYKNIHRKTKAKIIVAGYPKLLEQTGKGVLFNKYESELINTSVHVFNLKIHLAVLKSEIADNVRGTYHFVSVEEAFDGHEAYSDDPWINKVEIGTKKQDIKDEGLLAGSAYSVHPNKKGAEKYAECVQAKINELERDTSDERDIVLVLDVSGSMEGTPIAETKKASSNFISTVLKEDASIGVVTYNNSAGMRSDFSKDESLLRSITDGISAGGGTNIEAGLAQAEEMLAVSNAKKKIIVLMSDGEPNNGKVGNELISYADDIKSDGTYIYTLGFFESMGSGRSSAQELMEKLASDGCHYEVANADDLKFFFEDIADQINGQKYIYVRIACPVDVEVEYKGETLRSYGSNPKTRTSFGSLTFEDGSGRSGDSDDDRVKILRLKDNAGYDIKINGNGTGIMNYTIGFMDENGEYSDLREFNDVEISKHTKIDTVAKNASSTTLRVDSDGDGKYDLTYKADANGIGRIVNYKYIFYIIYAAAALVLLLVIYIACKKLRAKMLAKRDRELASQKKFCLHCGTAVPGNKSFCTNCGRKFE